jgi:hypothetical protein
MSVNAQSRFPAVDKSGMDLSYHPANYPILKIQNKISEPPLARLLYSRPAKNSRTIFGELVEYGKIWRLGANEATEIEFYKDVKIAGTKIKKGRYTLFAIPEADKWTMIINRDTDTWGTFKYDSKKDVLRTDIRTETTQETAEFFSMAFENINASVSLVIAWDNVLARLPIVF